MIEKIIGLIIVIAGAVAIIKYLVPYLGDFAGLATVIIAVIAIIIAVGILADYNFRGLLNR